MQSGGKRNGSYDINSLMEGFAALEKEQNAIEDLNKRIENAKAIKTDVEGLLSKNALDTYQSEACLKRGQEYESYFRKSPFYGSGNYEKICSLRPNQSNDYRYFLRTDSVGKTEFNRLLARLQARISEIKDAVERERLRQQKAAEEERQRRQKAAEEERQRRQRQEARERKVNGVKSTLSKYNLGKATPSEIQKYHDEYGITSQLLSDPDLSSSLSKEEKAKINQIDTLYKPSVVYISLFKEYSRLKNDLENKKVVTYDAFQALFTNVEKNKDNIFKVADYPDFFGKVKKLLREAESLCRQSEALRRKNEKRWEKQRKNLERDRRTIDAGSTENPLSIIFAIIAIMSVLLPLIYFWVCGTISSWPSTEENTFFRVLLAVGDIFVSLLRAIWTILVLPAGCALMWPESMSCFGLDPLALSICAWSVLAFWFLLTFAFKILENNAFRFSAEDSFGFKFLSVVISIVLVGSCALSALSMPIVTTVGYLTNLWGANTFWGVIGGFVVGILYGIVRACGFIFGAGYWMPSMYEGLAVGSGFANTIFYVGFGATIGLWFLTIKIDFDPIETLFDRIRS